MDQIHWMKQRSVLTEILNYELQKVMGITVNRCEDKLPQEPDYIVTLATDFAKNLYDALRTLFIREDFAVTSIYCHQKPRVKFEGKICELGDILFIYVHTDLNRRKTSNALLLQAKMSKCPISKTDNLKQLELYTRWPRFIYSFAGKMNNKGRDIFPKAVCLGAQYLLIDEGYFENPMNFDNFPMGIAVPSKILCTNHSFAEDLSDFFAFRMGRMIENYENYEGNDEWSNMIWDMVKITCGTVSRRKNSKRELFGRQSEYSNDGCLFYGNQNSLGHRLCRNIDVETTDEAMAYGEDLQGGIPIVLIESGNISGNDYY